MRALAIAAIGLVAATMSAEAQQAEPDIVVEAQRIQEAARSFARDVSAPPSREDQLARFDDRICPGVVGLNRRQGQFLADRIGQRALELNLEVGEPGCRANVLVLVTQTPSDVARAIAEEERHLVANYGVQENLNTRGEEALAHFISDERPVRWWHVAQTVTRDGEVLHNVQTQMWGGSNSSPHYVAEVVRANPLSASQNAAPTQQQFRNVVIIVDANRARAVRLGGLADYVSMVAFAQLAPEADTRGYDTVLNLFSSESAVTSMTDWDRAYLTGLYTVDPNATSARRQAGRIATEMTETLAH